jgi:hypothetical protein
MFDGMPDEVFEHIISPAMERCRLKPYRSDHLTAPGKISEQMFERILGDDLCIAILTGHNPNVFYELAIAHSAQRPVIIMLEKGKILPFDVKDLRCVPYDFWPSQILKGVYVDELVNQVEELRAADWKVPPISPVLDRFEARKGRSNDILFYERSADFGSDSRWLDLLTSAKRSFSIMGVALQGWVKTKDFESTVIQKARDGCAVRVMTLHEENPSINELEKSNRKDESAERVRSEIRLSSPVFRELATAAENIEYRQLRARTPNFALTLTEHTALLNQTTRHWHTGEHG